MAKRGLIVTIANSSREQRKLAGTGIALAGCGNHLGSAQRVPSSWGRLAGGDGTEYRKRPLPVSRLGIGPSRGTSPSGFRWPLFGPIMGRMPALTRRPDRYRQDCWRVFYGDVCVGTIGRRTGVPNGVDQWEWGCGFYPATERGEGSTGTAATFEAARAAFEAACGVFLPTRTEADFQAWREQRDRTAWKYAMWDAGMKMPAQRPDGTSRCFCGAEIDIRGVEQHIREAHQGMVAA